MTCDKRIMAWLLLLRRVTLDMSGFGVQIHIERVNARFTLASTKFGTYDEKLDL
jgi:hypothetical protein